MPIADAPGMFNDRKLNDLNIKKMQHACNLSWGEAGVEAS